MHFAKSILASASAVLALSGTPSFAQVAPIVDIAAIQTQCTSAAACRAAIAAAITAIEAAGLTPAQANTELGNLAAAVVEVAKEAESPIEAIDVVDMLDDIQQESTDLSQQASLEQAKSDAQAGNVDAIDTDSGFGSSDAG